MNSIHQYINLNGLEERKQQVDRDSRPRIVVSHDEVEIHGKGIVQKLIEKYKK